LIQKPKHSHQTRIYAASIRADLGSLLLRFGYSLFARSGLHKIWLNTSVPNNYAGTWFTNLINQNSTLKFTQKEVR
jgi:hypothetical protein